MSDAPKRRKTRDERDRDRPFEFRKMEGSGPGSVRAISANPNACFMCGGEDFWKAKGGYVKICRRCHAPAPGIEEEPHG